ncbi:MAG: hypothetical protein ACK401_03020 [Archaeoglobaceae archaeon]
MRFKIAVVAVLTLALCASPSLSGTFVCTKSSGKIFGFQNGTILEFKPNGEVYIKSPEGKGVVGKYDISGEKLNIKFEVLGTTLIVEGKLEGNRIVFNDGAVFEKR